MFSCFCKKRFSRRKDLMSHLKGHQVLNEFSFPTKCLQPNCTLNNSYKNFDILTRHLLDYHVKDDISSNCADLPIQFHKENDKQDMPTEQPEELESEFDTEYNVINSIDTKPVNRMPSIRNQVIEMILELKSNPNLSERLLNLIIKRFSSIFDNVIDSIVDIIPKKFAFLN